MEPEEIDKLFKNRLNGLPVMPSADAWARLHTKMEPRKKKRTMLVYYAAASLLILLVSGLLLFQNYRQNPVVTVAQTEVKVQADKNIQDIPSSQATTATPSASTSKTEILAGVEKSNGAAEKELKVE